MPKPKKIKSPADFGKEFGKLKKPRKQKGPTKNELQKELTPLGELQEYVEKCEKYPLDTLYKLEKKLMDCTTEKPTVITYSFTGDKTSLYIEFLDHIKVVADVYCTVRSFCIESKKPYLATAQKMFDVLKEWRGA